MDEENRRNFYRIDDKIQFNWRVITPEEKKSLLEARSKSSDKGVAMCQFMELETQIQDSLGKLRTYNPELSKIVELVNNKVNRLASQVTDAMPEHALMRTPTKLANIGVKGMSFQADEPCEPGQFVFIEMILSTSKSYMAVFGHVVRREEQKGSAYKLNIEFDEISEPDMARLSQHVMRLDAEQMQQRKSKPADLH